MAEDLSYPVGRFDRGASITTDMRSAAIDTIATLPATMRGAVDGLSDDQLDAPYRPGGWTVRQVVHHLADSHMNGYIRAKLALTEDNPTIKPYDQDGWSALADMRLPIAVSLGLLDGIHQRWTTVWKSVDPAQFARTFQHPEIGPLTLDQHLQLYAWHSRHHVAHITSLRTRNGW
jgi:hypothetical protein